MATPILALYTCKVSMNEHAPARLGELIEIGLAFAVRGSRAFPSLCSHVRV
jgi:hypothetical protein